jgi:hypothetical protein
MKITQTLESKLECRMVSGATESGQDLLSKGGHM